ncbi:MAG TPA: hypothetical protein LFW20_02385 [Rickettsia endosymbiont of Omalisus fontisbellaquei]|nr:hypothetical protein [Rickettsia endosymbiont of Omalisus fontisbellaquei]
MTYQTITLLLLLVQLILILRILYRPKCDCLLINKIINKLEELNKI